MSVANLTGRTDPEKVDLLCYTMAEQSEQILLQIIPTAASRKVYATVKDKFESYFAPKKNIIFERYKFYARVQVLEETVNAFITALYTLAEKCEYGSLKNDSIRDRIVLGIRDTRASNRMQLKPDLTVDEAIIMSRLAEAQPCRTR